MIPLKQVEIRFLINSKLNIGVIIECKEGRNYGVLVATTTTIGDKLKLFTFSKDESRVIKAATLVSFLYTEKEQYLINDVYECALYEKQTKKSERISIDQLLKYPTSDRWASIKGYCMTIEEWGLFFNRIPFIWSGTDSFMYPAATSEDTLIFHECSVPKLIFDFINEKSLHEISAEEIRNKIKKLNDYISTFDYLDAINTLTSGQEKVYITRPGQDYNYEMYTNYTRIETDDKYIKSLVPLKEDSFVDEVCFSSGVDYNNINTDVTNHYKNNAINLYNKDMHFAFLLKEWFKDEYKRRQTYLSIRYCILMAYHYFEILDVYDEYLKNNWNYSEKPSVLIKNLNKTINYSMVSPIYVYDHLRDKVFV